MSFNVEGKLYDFIQTKRGVGYSYRGYPVYDVTRSDIRNLKSLADKYGIPLEWFGNLINHETAGTFNPAITNSIGATGLIQFLPSTAQNLGTSTSALREMSFSEQLQWVDKYLFKNFDYLNVFEDKESAKSGKNYKVKNTFNQGDLFMTIFYPASVGKDFNTYTFPSSVPENNAGIYKPKDYVDKALKNAPFPNADYFLPKFGSSATFWWLIPIALFGGTLTYLYFRQKLKK